MFQSVTKRFDPIKVKKSNKSETVPDMSFTPREIIQKFSRGEKVPLGFNGLYDDENASEFDENPTRDPNFDRFDFVEEKHALDERNAEREKMSRSKVEGESNSQRKANDKELSASDATKRETTSGEVDLPPSGQ